MKTNVSIKFNSVEEYREIENKLIELGYKPRLDPYWFCVFGFSTKYVTAMPKKKIFDVYSYTYKDEKVYNSLQEFLNNWDYEIKRS